MQIKNILKSLLVAYALTGACLLGLAWLGVSYEFWYRSGNGGDYSSLCNCLSGRRICCRKTYAKR